MWMVAVESEFYENVEADVAVKETCQGRKANKGDV
jgi:hypothetical protein